MQLSNTKKMKHTKSVLAGTVRCTSQFVHGSLLSLKLLIGNWYITNIVDMQQHHGNLSRESMGHCHKQHDVCVTMIL